jgi:hypothetical protein
MKKLIELPCVKFFDLWIHGVLEVLYMNSNPKKGKEKGKEGQGKEGEGKERK